jgi:DcuC family C4-dicarboxylate transporter
MNLRSLAGRLPILNRAAWGALIAVLALAALGAAAAAPAGHGKSAVATSWIPISVAVVDMAIVLALFSRGLDARLLLLLGALPLFAVMGRMPEMIVKIAGEMANLGTVVPICSAMGFAFVLRLTECDQNLVRMLITPLRQLRALLVPGGIIAGYLINTTIVSQAGTAAVLGPILIPLLRAGGLSPVSAGAILLLGSSMGGELFNPGSVEMRKLAELTATPSAQVVGRSARFNLLACATAAGAFWALSTRRRKNPDGGETAGLGGPTQSEEPEPVRFHLIKALVPILPILLLSLDAVFGPFSATRAIDGPAKILAAMLIGVMAAGLTSIQVAGKLSSAFFEGAGFGYNHVISLIVAASTFAEGIRLSGLIEILIRALVTWPAAALVVAMAAPWSLAFVSGTGIAPAVAIMEFFVPVAGRMGIDPVRLGTLTALGAHFGRTMSPAAAVVMMSARLSSASPSELIRRVAVPLLAGGVVLVGAVLLKLI